MPTVSHGYPDFGRYEAQADVVFLNLSGQTINGDTFYPLGFVGAYRFIGMRFNSLNNGFQVTAQFYAESTYTTYLGTFTLEVWQNSAFGGAIPISGPFCRIEVSPQAPASSFDLQAWSSTNEFTTYTRDGADNILITEKARSVAAGANFTWDAARTWPGAAHLNIHTTAAVWTAELYGVGSTGLLAFLAFLDSPGKNYNEDFILPARTARLIVHNGDAASKFFDVSLSGRPWTPGR